MTIRDHQGFVLTGASAEAAESYRRALHSYHCYAGDAIGAADAAIDASPTFVMAQILKAYMHILGTNQEAAAVGAAAYAQARPLPANHREQGHLAAVGALLSGEMRKAARILEDVAIDYPRDVLALQIGQMLDFFLGEQRMLRDRIARALPAWSRDIPDYHVVLGCLAFGLEETGQYERAEAVGREAVALEPRDNWAQHAVAHVLEMQDRREEGVTWMTREATGWQDESFFAVHNWWHTALFHLGLGEPDQALALYDGPIYGQASTFALDMVDAAALLWRLHLQGVELGDRWTPLADAFASEPRGQYAFDDAHAMLAYVGAGRDAAQRQVLDRQAAALTGPGDNAYFVSEVGLAVMRAIQAFGRDDYGRAVELLRGVRNKAMRYGGSNAQRDLLDLTLIEAARRDGQDALHRALLAEREAARATPTRSAARLAAE
ncbi:tetratricopeptide repeat protein [Phenylobacterium sp. LjRoot219]|uniref:tetratricopeptide repeat protein n=1 Tax=Phenylobacterium sp. LjRoot219 TaxID=3342283 RepID=UPI003ECFDB08